MRLPMYYVLQRSDTHYKIQSGRIYFNYSRRLITKVFFITSYFYKHISQGGFDDQQTVNPTFSDNTRILPTPHVLSKYLLLLEVYL